jgi:type II secretory pathway pseudopilin PulG
MRPRRRPNASGFTLIELLVALFVTVEIIIAVLLLFDLNNKLARVQTNVAEMQQSQRIAQYDMVRTLRMTGRGAFMSRAAYSASPETYNSLGAGVLNNITGDIGILTGSSNASTNPKILPGTDVLRIRGVLSTPVYQINTVDPAAFTLVDADNDNIPETGQLIINNVSPTGVAQDLHFWTDLLNPVGEYRPEALLLASPLSDAIYAVAQMDPGNSSYTGPAANPTQVTIAFLVESATSPYDAAYNSLNPIEPTTGNPQFPTALATAASVGILEEYRFYIRELHVDAGNATSDLAPRLSRARVFPGTNVAYGPAGGGAANNENLRADIADNIFDLQVAVGLDTNNDQQIAEASPPAADDDWLFNVAADDPTAAQFQPLTPLYYVRVTTLALTDRRDPKYSAPTLAAIEDHDYSSHALNTAAANRMFRHRLLQTQVDLRNY